MKIILQDKETNHQPTTFSFYVGHVYRYREYLYLCVLSADACYLSFVNLHSGQLTHDRLSTAVAAAVVDVDYTYPLSYIRQSGIFPLPELLRIVDSELIIKD